MKKVLITGLLMIALMPVFAQKIAVSKQTIEYRSNPLGVENTHPYLSWQLVSNQNGTRQTAYQVLVSDDSIALVNDKANIWDTKRTLSEQSVNILYKGKPLQASQTYYWKVRVWDNSNTVSEWSAINKWQMGLLNAADWKQAQWIAYDKMADSLYNPLPIDGKKDKASYNNILPLFRKEFTVTKKVKKATLFMSGLGHFEATINGKPVSDHFMDAGWSKYDKEALYVTLDVTPLLANGSNAIGAIMGNGFVFVPPVAKRFRKLKVMHGHPMLIGRLKVTYDDGTEENIVTDQSWKTAKSPITFSSIYGGEDYDANLEQPGWNKAGFKDAAWQQPVIVKGSPVLKSQQHEPLKVMATFLPLSAKRIDTGDWVYDMGQNASGIVAIKLQGNKGDTVRIYPGELLDANGHVTQKATGAPFYYQYVLKGGAVEEYQPKFTYYGFRYIQIKGANYLQVRNGQPKLLEVKTLHTRNAMAENGVFKSSNELFNKTETLINWAIRSNVSHVLTDCPHREKLGWMEQVHLMSPSMQYSYDMAAMGRKTMNDIKVGQLENGLIAETNPEYVYFTWGEKDMFRDSPEWGSSGIIYPWYAYNWYGDLKMLTDMYPTMQRYIDYLKERSENLILRNGLGDWYDIGPKAPGVSQLTPLGVTGTAIFYYNLNIMQKVATLLNRPADVKQYAQLAAQVRKAFNDTYFNPATKQYATGSQTSNAMALYMDLVPKTEKTAVLKNLVQGIVDSSYRLTAGDIGFRYVVRVLEKEGYSDILYKMNSRSDVPGYGYQLAKGATALTESWMALPTVSNNHLMLGHLKEWFYSGLAGLKIDSSAIGYKKFIVAPTPVGDVTQAEAAIETLYGNVTTNWQKQADGSFYLHVEVPVNTSATVILPFTARQVTLNNKVENNKEKLALSSGKYDIVAKP
ncbi:family 78 glycoside hydrolase catalytic domain [Polluticaenibacter yanchengensis]|uniref:alpha-L-rhamnosidase n=1 Tax=Polluticaenibacter yanchengensis TaxID=3014562 RepID=A0ABT4ULV6_9BACT|nr:family 78 glycoside hydrolase catalytic domain [Chitinophagaceae bacterium LY-5]